MKEITLYPSSWYYNACVYGFLEVLAHGLGTNVVEEEILNTGDGTVNIPKHFLEKMYAPSGQLGGDVISNTELTNLAWWWLSLSAERKLVGEEKKRLLEAVNVQSSDIVNIVFNSLLLGNKSIYCSLGQPRWSDIEKIEFLNNWFSIAQEEINGIHCGFCGMVFNMEYDGRNIDKYFNMSMASKLGTSTGEFPNITWNYNYNLPVCKICRSQFLCFHFVHRNGFFINTESLSINWHLNHLIADKLQKKRGPTHHVLLEGIKLDPQMRRTLGGWGMQRIEMIQFNRDKKLRTKVEYFQIPQHLSNLFLIPEISYLISSMKNELALDYLFKGRHEYFPEMIYKSIRQKLSGQNSEDMEWEDVDRTIRLYQYLHLNSAKKGGTKTMNLNSLSKCADDAPSALKKKKNGLVFRLLELTRMGKKEDIYHLLLRTFIAESKPFPVELREVFTIDDSAVFKNSIYAFIAGLSSQETDNE